jgi:hypothetical protein
MKKILFLMLMLNFLYGWETTTHRAIDKTAIESGNARNLIKFIDASGIKDEDYTNERFESYGLTYFEYFNNDLSSDAMADWNQTFDGDIRDYQDLIEAGTMLEDAQWQNNALLGANGRFLNHFYDPQNGGKGLWWNVNAVDWAKGNLYHTVARFNYYSYFEAMHYFKEGFTNKDTSERRRFQAKMLVSVGHIV